MNTSNEPQKSGISPDEVIAFAKELIEDKDNLYTGLVFKGLMTIGELDGDATQDFKVSVRFSLSHSLASRRMQNKGCGGFENPREGNRIEYGHERGLQISSKSFLSSFLAATWIADLAIF